MARKGSAPAARARSPAARSPNPPRDSSVKTKDARTDRAAFLLTVLVLAAAGTASISLSVPLPLTAQSKRDLEALWLCCIAVSLPHIFYLWLWRSPRAWIARCEKIKADPSRCMCEWALLLKAVQACAFFVWVCTREPPEQVLAKMSERAGKKEALLTVSIVLLTMGQVLNGSCFRALGVDGIYYGVKFGKKIPWCRHWPYGGNGSIPHPQYVGCVLTIWGMILAVCTPAHYTRGALGLGTFWSILYVLSGIVEHCF